METTDHNYNSAASLDTEEINEEETSGEPSNEIAFEEAVWVLTETINKAPLHREIFLKVLNFCIEQHSLTEVEQTIQEYPEFPSVAQSPYSLVRTLVHAKGLAWLELGENGKILTLADKEGLTSDEIEDITYGYAVITTPVGAQVADDLAPIKRLRSLMGNMPQRLSTYVDVLDFCRQSRSFKDVEVFLRARGGNTLVAKTGSQPLNPSFFVDTLERAGGLVWNNGWQITPGGLELLKSLA